MNIAIDYFLFTLFIGVLIIYIKSPKPSIIIKNSIISSGDIIYTDETGICTKYDKIDAMCRLDPTVKIFKLED
jgi:hypothetical protein